MDLSVVADVSTTRVAIDGGVLLGWVGVERINSRQPPSLSFELRTKRISGYAEKIPYLDYTGIADVSSMDVFDASKIEDRKGGTLTNVESASEWLIAYFEEIGGAPQKIRDLESAAQEAGRWFSKGTFERARERAGVEPMQATELKATLGEEYDWLPSEDLRARDGSTVASRTPQLPSG